MTDICHACDLPIEFSAITQEEQRAQLDSEYGASTHQTPDAIYVGRWAFHFVCMPHPAQLLLHMDTQDEHHRIETVDIKAAHRDELDKVRAGHKAERRKLRQNLRELFNRLRDVVRTGNQAAAETMLATLTAALGDTDDAPAQE